MSRYATHSQCESCWVETQPGRVPVRIVEEARDIETCCRCGQPTRSGIYIRAELATMPHCTMPLAGHP